MSARPAPPRLLDEAAAEAFGRMDAAADAMDEVATELEGAAALLGARERARGVAEAPDAPALMLTSLEAHGVAQILGLIADQLRRAEADLRGRTLRQTG